MIKPFRSRTDWPLLAGAALASSVVTLFISRNFMQTEKKIRHRIRAEYQVSDPVFPRVMGGLMGPPLLEGNRVDILQNGDEIFPAMIEAIRSAQHSITLENFLWRDGEVAWALTDALIERARQGVRVYVLQDAFGCDSVYSGAMRALRNSPVEVEIFRWLWLSRINFRTHRKLMIVDGHTGFIGGVCIADTWQGDGLSPGHWRDTHYRVQGPTVSQLQQAFLDNWMQTRAQVLHGEKFFPALERKGSISCQAFKSSAGEGADSARLMFLLSVAAARERICIASAFFLPDNLMIQTLIQARQRGVEIDVIIPGEDNDSPIVRLAGRSRWRPMLESGIRFWEYQPARYHCKYLIVDDSWCSVGSTNIDHRSMRLNEEANLNILNGDFARAHLKIFREDLQRSRQITLRDWHRRPICEKITGHIAALGRLSM